MKGRKNYEKMSVFEQVMEGLNEGLAHVRGELTLRTTVLPAPPPRMSKSRVVAIRSKANMSQAVFAGLLNVPKRTLQSWEQGARTPKAGEARLLQIMDVAPDQIATIICGGTTPISKVYRTRRASANRSRTVVSRGTSRSSRARVA